MENLLNPVIVAVLLLCVLCLLKVNVLLSMLISLFVAGLIGGLPIVSSGDEASIMSSVVAGFSGNAETALAYVLLGTFASAMAYTGITEILSKKIAKAVGGNKWILAVAMVFGLAIAVFITYRKPREYKDIQLEGVHETEDLTLKYEHWVTLAAIVVVVALQIIYGSLPVAALGGLLVMFIFRAVKPKDIDEQFQGGIKLMGFIAFVMLVAGGFATVLQNTGAVNELVKSAISLMGGNKWIAATVITLIGLLVTMGIGTSFGTVPVLAVLYVPLCHEIGFSPAATIVLMSAAAALGDAGSPASDTTLGPTSGLNADGQHDHIWDTCVPTFLHFNIPLMIAAIVAAQFL